MEKEGIVKVLMIVGGVMLVLLTLGVLGVATFLVMDSLSSATSIAGVGSTTWLTANTSTVKAMNYTTTYVISTDNNCLATVTAMNSSGQTIGVTGNYSVSGCTITPLSTAMAGINNTIWLINGYYTSNKGVNEVTNNVTVGIGNFFTNIPTIFTILGIVALIGAIVMIIYFVTKLGGREHGGGGL